MQVRLTRGAASKTVILMEVSRSLPTALITRVVTGQSPEDPGQIPQTGGPADFPLLMPPPLAWWRLCIPTLLNHDAHYACPSP